MALAYLQMRVLAARDGSGSVPLLEARTAEADCLVIASHPALLKDCHDVVSFHPGFFKNGGGCCGAWMQCSTQSGQGSRSAAGRRLAACDLWSGQRASGGLQHVCV